MSLDLSSFLLPPPPASWDANHDVKVHKRISPVKSGRVEPVGNEFLSVLRRHVNNRSLTQDWELEAALKGANDEDDDEWVEEPETPQFLKSINPDNWKKQDHYMVLGIARLRWRATDAQIKTAYRKKVLKHHPDKKAAASGRTNDDAYFKCLQKAWEIITDPKKRREFDSCDPTFDDTVPTSLKKGQDFYEVFGPAFEKEARFSKDPAIFDVKLGDANSSREEVELFYKYWINFDSWRTFEMLDEEEEGLDDSREAKRWLDKKNRANRSRLKKEDNQRVIKFIEAAMKLDPRILKIKEEEKIARDLKKNAAKYAAEKEAAEKKRLEEEAAAAAALAAAEEKQKREGAKKDKEAVKKLARKARNAVRAVFSDNHSFLAVGAKSSDLEAQQIKFDSLLEALDLLQLEDFKKKLDAKVSGGPAALNAVLDEEIARVKK